MQGLCLKLEYFIDWRCSQSSTTNVVLFALALVMMGLLLAAFVAFDQTNWIVVCVELLVCVAVFLLVGFLGLGIKNKVSIFL